MNRRQQKNKEEPFESSLLENGLFSPEQLVTIQSVCLALQDPQGLIDVSLMRKQLEYFGMKNNLIFFRVLGLIEEECLANREGTKLEFSSLVTLLARHAGSVLSRAGREQLFDHINRSQTEELSHQDIKDTLEELGAAKNDDQVKNIIFTVTDKKSVKAIPREDYLSYVNID